MTTATVRSVSTIGVAGRTTDIVVDLADGLPSIDVVGMAEAAVREIRVRVRSSIVGVGRRFPEGRVNVTLQPAHLRKDGTGFDLPIALAMLAASGQIPADRLDGVVFLGELGLDGSLRAVRGAIVAAETAAAAGARLIIVPAENGPEALASSLPIAVRTARHLRDVIAWANGDDEATSATRASSSPPDRSPMPDMAEVQGQPLGRRAVEIAAAGGHNILLVGGLGSGKTMLARRIPGILSDIDDSTALEITRVASVAGLNIGGGLIRRAPFRAPHHSTTSAGLVGGGAPVARPGEMSLAHGGVLFLDEVTEFSRQSMEMLREPMQTGEIALSRAAGVVTYPARALIVAAMNPCPCGQHGHPRLRCRCSDVDRMRHDTRVDERGFVMRVEIPPVSLSEIHSANRGESSDAVKARVTAARKVLASIAATDYSDAAGPFGAAKATVSEIAAMRSVARTIAALAGSVADVGTVDARVVVTADHAAEAVSFRILKPRETLQSA